MWNGFHFSLVFAFKLQQCVSPFHRLKMLWANPIAFAPLRSSSKATRESPLCPVHFGLQSVRGCHTAPPAPQNCRASEQTREQDSHSLEPSPPLLSAPTFRRGRRNSRKSTKVGLFNRLCRRCRAANGLCVGGWLPCEARACAPGDSVGGFPIHTFCSQESNPS